MPLAKYALKLFGTSESYHLAHYMQSSQMLLEESYAAVNAAQTVQMRFGRILATFLVQAGRKRVHYGASGRHTGAPS